MRLSDLTEAIVDCEHKTAPEGDGFAYSVGTKAMKSGRLVLAGAKPVSAETYDGWTRRMRPRPGDLILAREAPVGDVIRVPDDPLVCLGQRTVLIRPDESKVHPRFLHYWLLGPDAQGVMRAQTGGATVGHLNVEDIRKLDVAPMPKSESHQAASAELLGAIDDLIENNRRRVAVLEDMARAIYREWFVHFRYPGHQSVPLVDSTRGAIPEGWEMANLFDAADVGFGYSFKSPQFADEGPFQVIRIRDIPVGVSGTFTDEEADPRYAVFDDDVLIGMDGDFHMTVWTGKDAWLNQRVTRLRPKRRLSPLHLLLSIEGQIIAWNKAILGTTVAHLGKKHLEHVTVLLPDAATLTAATESFDSLMAQRRALEQENRRLFTLRDLLLPKLVTGQIDLSGLTLDPVAEAGAA